MSQPSPTPAHPAPTEPGPGPATGPTFADQYGAIAALAAMAQAFPALPAAYIVVHQPVGGRGLLIQTRGPADFEAWREALRLPTEGVELEGHGRTAWLEVSGTWSASPVLLTGHEINAPEGGGSR